MSKAVVISLLATTGKICSSFVSNGNNIVTLKHARQQAQSTFMPQLEHNAFHRRSDINQNGPLFADIGNLIPEEEWEGEMKRKSQPSQTPASDPTSSFLSTDGSAELRKTDSSSTYPDSPRNDPSLEQYSYIKRQNDLESQFLHGDELIELRQYVSTLEHQFTKAEQDRDELKILDVQRAIQEANNLDAEFVYNSYLKEAHKLEERKNNSLKVEELRKKALAIRKCLPQFNLHGLWIGKYGDQGYEMINVTYVGDTLIATKVTSEQNVPKGEITFKSDLSLSAPGREILAPIKLTEIAAAQWGQKSMPRFPGKGQVADKGFEKSQWIDGQLILVGKYFSFAWVPLGHQIFFGRPSAELTLKMLRESQMAQFGAEKDKSNPLAENRAYVQRCFEETEMLIHDDSFNEGQTTGAVDNEYHFNQEGCFE